MDLGLGSFLGGVGGGIASGLFGQSSARESMRFQERMSRTQYQRAAVDLEKAGLNRVLALGSPASSPSGATATMPDIGAGFTGAFNARTQRDLSKTQAAANEAAASRDNSATVVNAATATKVAQEAANLGLDQRLKELEVGKQELLKGWMEKFGPAATDLFDAIPGVLDRLGNTAKSIPEKAGAHLKLFQIDAGNKLHSAKEAADKARNTAAPMLPFLAPFNVLYNYTRNKAAIAPYVRKK